MAGKGEGTTESRELTIPGTGVVKTVPEGTDIKGVKLKDEETVASIPEVSRVAVIKRQNLQEEVVVNPKNPEDVKSAALVAGNGDPKVAGLLVDVAESVGSTIPQGAAKYAFVAEGIKKYVEKNPEVQNSKMVQLGYAMSLLFSKLFGFTSDETTYSSFVDAFYSDEKMSQEETQEYLNKKYKDTKKLPLRDAYFKCEKELESNEKSLSEKPKDEVLLRENKYLKEKRDVLKNMVSVNGDVSKLTPEELATASKIYEGLGKEDFDKLNKLAESKPEYIDSMASVAYVSRILGITVENNDPDRLHAKLLHTKYFRIPESPDAGHNLYTKTPDIPTFVKRAKAQTLAVNTVVFFSERVGDKSFMMAGIVGYDGKIHYQKKDDGKGNGGLHELSDNDLDNFYNPISSMQFKGSFEAEESEYNTEILGRQEPAAQETTDTSDAGAQP